MEDKQEYRAKALESWQIFDGPKELWNKDAEINNPYQPLKEDTGEIQRPGINDSKIYAVFNKDWFMIDKTLIL